MSRDVTPIRGVLRIGNGGGMEGWVYADHIEAVVIVASGLTGDEGSEVVVMTVGGQRLVHSKWDTREAAREVAERILHGSWEVYDYVTDPRLVTYSDELAAALAGGPVDFCATHMTHKRTDVWTTLGTMTVFDAADYRDIPGYCTADDEVSRVLAMRGAWEPWISAALDSLHALDDPQPGELVMDFGAHIGWWTRMCGKAGYEVVAVDGEPEHLELVSLNVRGTASPETPVVLVLGWMDEQTKTVPLPTDGSRIRLVKADVESAERHVIRALGPVLEAGLVEWLVLEISPVFRDDYAETVLAPLRELGYQAWTTAPKCEPWDWVMDWPQTEIIFGRRETP